MDDLTQNSPPSSRKSSVLGKLDRPETPNRGSPYLTRSRKSSTLTEENIAAHNDTPTTATRRITRRMSQGNDNAAVLTPMPQVTKRTRRSPSVTSGDDLTATPKKKFAVALDSVEEDETMEENKIESEVDKENINTVVNGIASEETLHRKSQDFSKSGLVMEQPTEPKVSTVTVDSNELAVSTSNSDAIPVDIPAKSTEPLNANVSTTQSSDPQSTSSPDQNLAANSQTTVSINEQPQLDSAKLSDSSFITALNSTSEMNTTAEQSLETSSVSLKLNDTSIVELNDTVFEIKTPTKSVDLAASDVIVIPETPNASIAGDVINLTDTPLQARKSSITETQLQTGKSSTPDVPETLKVAPSTVKAVQQVDSPKTPVQEKNAAKAVSSTVKAVQQVDSPKTPVQEKNASKAVSSTVKAVQQVDSPKTPVQEKNASKAVSSTVKAVQQVDSPKTPVQEKNASKAVSSTVKAVQQVDSPKTPVQEKNASKAVSSTVKAVQQVDSPKTPVQEKNASKAVSSTVKAVQQVDSPKTPVQEKNASKAVSSTVKAVQQVDSPKTPVLEKTSVTTDVRAPVTRSSMLKTPKAISVQQTDTPMPAKASVTPDLSTSVTPLAVPKAAPVTQQADSTASPKTPLQNKKTSDVTTPVTISEATKILVDGTATPNSNLNVTESEEERLLMTPPTPKTVSELKPEAVVVESVPTVDSTPKVDVDEAKSAPLQNGSLDGSSKCISADGEQKSNTESPPSKVKPIKKNTLTVNVLDSSDEESHDNADSNSENGSPNIFLDDEAMESNGEASMDEEERKYLEENEIPEDGISLGSGSDDEALSEEEETDDSFIVSDSSVQLLDGSGDDLGLENECARSDKLVNKTKRGNKILDTSDEEEPKKSAKKRRPESSLNHTAKYLRVDEEDEEEENAQHKNVNESGGEDELANLDVEPKKTRNSKRLSGTSAPSKKDTKRLSLHPNLKLSSVDSNDQESTVVKNDSLKADDDSEEEVTQELANLDEGPLVRRSKRLSEPWESFKNTMKRKSLHPNTKLSSVNAVQKENDQSSVDLNHEEKQTVVESVPTTVDESSKAIVEEELVNLDSEPKKTYNKKRLSESNSLSKNEMKRLSLHPNTKFSSLKSNEGVQEQNQDQQQQSKAVENGFPEVMVIDDDRNDVEEELANLDDQPKIIGTSKRLSDTKSPSKSNPKRYSLQPLIKMQRPGFDFKIYASPANEVEKIGSIVAETDANGRSSPGAGEQKMESERSVEEIQARCDAVLQEVNEARRLEKLNRQPMQDDKYQRLKEKKAAKLQEKKAKEARELEREAQAAKQRQLKRDKKSIIAEITEQEKSRAIQKAMDFSETIKARKVQHSNVATLTESTEEEPVTPPAKNSKRKRKPKKLQILNAETKQTTKKNAPKDAEQIPAKPEGFKVNSIPVGKRRKIEKTKTKQPKGEIQKTTAGGFEIQPDSPFIVTTLQYDPMNKFNPQHNTPVKFTSMKDQVILNSKVKRVSSVELLNRKKQLKKLAKN